MIDGSKQKSDLILFIEMITNLIKTYMMRFVLSSSHRGWDDWDDK